MNSKRKLKGAEIDLLTILGNVWKKKYIIILVCFLCALAMFLRSEFLLAPTYTASATMYANNFKESLEGDKDKISSSDMSASVKLINACGVIIKSEPVMNRVAEEMGVNWVPGTINVYSVNETMVFKIDVTYTDPVQAAAVANAIAKVAPDQIAGIVDGCSIKPISSAKVPTAKSWPSNRTEALKGAVIGLAVSLFAVCIITLLDTRIKKEEDLERWEYPILGVIPSFTAAQKGGAYASSSKGGNK